MASCLMLLGVPCLWAEDWPQWRGPNRDARVTGFKAPNTWPKQLPQKWKVTVGESVASPALVGDKLYVFAREGGDEILRCLDAATGKEQWQDKYPAKPPGKPATGFNNEFVGPRSSPTVADGKVVTLGVQGALSCYDAATGKLLWRKDDFKGSVPRFFTSSSPIVMDGLCIAQLGGDNGGGIVAYDLATGEPKWKWTGDGAAYSSPVLMTVDGTKLIVAMTAAKMVTVGAADGKLAWETPFVAERGSYNAATPIVDGQTIIYTGGRRGTRAVKLEKQGDGLAAKELWSNPNASVQFNTPVLKDGFLYGVSQGNELFCVNAQNGETAWTVPVSKAAGGAPMPKEKGKGGMRGGGGGGGYGSVVDAGSVLLALTPASELIVLQPNGKAYTELARIKVANTQTYAYPVVSGTRIYIEDQNSVTLWTVE
jgi:outer membrane protein assembly factor BamB